MKMKSILEEPNIKCLADNVKNIILENKNEYSWEELRSNHGFNPNFLQEIVSEMMNIGEIYEPVLGVLSVAGTRRDS